MYLVSQYKFVANPDSSALSWVSDESDFSRSVFQDICNKKHCFNGHDSLSIFGPTQKILDLFWRHLRNFS